MRSIFRKVVPLWPTVVSPVWWCWGKVLSRGEESCGDVGLNNGFSGFFMVGEDMSAGNKKNRGGQIYIRF